MGEGVTRWLAMLALLVMVGIVSSLWLRERESTAKAESCIYGQAAIPVPNLEGLYFLGEVRICGKGLRFYPDFEAEAMSSESEDLQR